MSAGAPIGNSPLNNPDVIQAIWRIIEAQKYDELMRRRLKRPTFKK